MTAAASSPLLRADKVTVHLDGRAVVESASLILWTGELVALVGPNGAGKTSLMRALAGLLPAIGNIEVSGRQLDALSPRERARAIAYLPQGHVFHWPMNVAAGVALGRHPPADAFSSASPDDRAAIQLALAATATEEFSKRPVTTLSGGERARVALARALATEATVLLADEPTASLDPRPQLVLMDLLRRTTRNGRAVLAILHDLTLAARFADRVLLMDRGGIIADGAPSDALSSARVAQVFGVDMINVDTGEGMIPIARRPL